MAKAPKKAYVCNDCGADYVRWQGQCSACKAWNTITEVRLVNSVSKGDRFSGYAGETVAKVQTLSEILSWITIIAISVPISSKQQQCTEKVYI